MANSFNNHELKLLLEVLFQRPELATFLDECVVEELEDNELFDQFEMKLTEKGCTLLHTLTLPGTP